MDIDKSATIGNAFDNYKYFKRTSWAIEVDEQKRRIVSFRGVYDLDKFAGGSFNTVVGVSAELTPELIAKAKQASPGLEYSFIVQFKLAVDGGSFQVGYHGLHITGTEENGTPLKLDLSDENDQGFQAIYQNVPYGAVGSSLLTVGKSVRSDL